MAEVRVLVVGGGGVGTMAALNLATGGQTKVDMVLRSNFDVVQDKGFDVESVDHGTIKGWRPDRIFNRVPGENADLYDYVVCCTKYVQGVKPSIAEIIRPVVTRGMTTIVLVQNGLNIEKPLVQAFPGNAVLSGITFMGSHQPQPGVIEHKFADKMLIGAFDHPHVDSLAGNIQAKDFARLYGAAGKTDCQVVDDTNHSRWEKLVYNATMNPICAILRTDTARIRLSESVDELIRPAMEEIRAVAAAKGCRLPESVVQKMIDIDPMNLFFQPSMCVDALKGNLTEYEVLVGEPLREGLECGVSMPTMKVIYNMCRALQWQLKEQRGLLRNGGP